MSPTLLHAADASTSTAAADAADSRSAPPVGLLLRLEAVLVVVASLAAYQYLGFPWWLFAALLLAPDLSFVGYAGGSKLGAWCYDLVHTYVTPAILGGIGFALHEPLVMALAAIWFAHISLDRVIGYGLKFAGSPKDTHMSRAATGRG